jgi:hypothetical protein
VCSVSELIDETGARCSRLCPVAGRSESIVQKANCIGKTGDRRPGLSQYTAEEREERYC